MKEKVFNVEGRNYKVVEIKEGHIYELKKQRSNLVFYKVSRYNDTSIENAIKYAKKYKIKCKRL